jgi:hypothetical protein
MIDLSGGLGQSPRPQPFDKNAQAVIIRGNLVSPLQFDFPNLHDSPFGSLTWSNVPRSRYRFRTFGI